MFGWFEHNPEIVHRHSSWIVKYQCHCGKIYNNYHDFCSACGCFVSLTPNNNLVGEIKRVIGRMEWDQDVNKHIYDEWVLNDWEFSNCSNVHWVEKPEGCQKDK